MYKTLVLAACLHLVLCATAQDSTRILNEITIEGYLYERPLSEVPASVGYVNNVDFSRFNEASILPVVNTLPGIRMEERSPGSYRFSVRGSLLRSPFGVRNVKVYWNSFPLTDGGGNTYLNLLDLSSLKSIEVIKGPAGSLYGAGTGGVVLLNTFLENKSHLDVAALTGSYGLQRYQLAGGINTSNLQVSFNYARHQAEGYRQQTEMKKDAANIDLRFHLNKKSILSASAFYTDIFYETPGGLNKMQFEENPQQARPAGGPFGSAVEQHASVQNRTFYAGIMHDYQWSDQWSTRYNIYGSFTNFNNFAIFNFEHRDETNWGGRLENQFVYNHTNWKSKITFGGEYQYFYSPIQVYENEKGTRGMQNLNDELTSKQILFFTQAEIDLPKKFFLTVGSSINLLQYNFIRFDSSKIEQNRNFNPIISPRVALLKKISSSLSIFTSVSSGFSPPTLAEVRPSTGTFSNTLTPENGINYEMGFRGSVLKKQISFDVTAYEFRLKETIVIQRNNSGAEYFINAGGTKQRGIEGLINWNVSLPKHGFVNAMRIWSSYTYNHYRFDEYVRAGEDFSGNALTGVAPTTFVSGLDINTKASLYFNITTNYVDHIPLNDANSEFAKSFFLIGAKLGYKKVFSKNFVVDVFAGIDNAMDETYSLGNDLNAAGGRFYNAAAPRNYYVGLKARGILSNDEK